MLKTALHCLPASALLALLVGCGGGGGSPVAVTQTLAGAAATGSPLKNAVIFVKDVNGREPVGQDEQAGVPITTTDAQGAYTLDGTSLKGLNAPLIVRAVGKSVSDQGDDIVVTLHSIATMSASNNNLNITQLTEAGVLLALGKSPSMAFAETGSLNNVSAQTLASSNRKLLDALSLQSNNTLSGLDVFSSSLDTDQSTTNTAALGKAHDLLLDKYAVVNSQGVFNLVDRNRASTDEAGAPSVSLTPGQSQPSVNGVHDNSEQNQPTLSYVTKLPSLIARLNNQLASGCTVHFDPRVAASCSGVLSTSNKIFASSFMDSGMNPEKYLRSWVVNPLDIEDISGVTVSVEAAFRGQWVGSDNKTYTRIFLRWNKADGDFVIRPAIVQLDGNGDLLLVGNQKKFMIKVFPRLAFAPDSDGTYPYNPRYENSLNLVVKHWYAGQSDVIKGALFSGPGLPSSRSLTAEPFIGETGNRNGISNGVEVFDRRVSGGCSNMSVDPSVYVQKNLLSWNDAWNAYRADNYSPTARATLYDGRIRWRAGSPNCNPAFDFSRYYRSGETYTLPKNGDPYTVVLYVDKAKADADPSLLSEMDSNTPHALQNDDGDTINVYYKTVAVRITGDAFPANVTLSDESRPGVKDEVRTMLKNLQPGQDRLIQWTKNSFFLNELNGQGNTIKTPFFNFMAGSYLAAYDQWRTVDSYSGNGTDDWTKRPFKRYQALFTTGNQDTLKNYCGQTASWADEDVQVFAQKSTRSSVADPWPTSTVGLPSGLVTAYFEPTTCPDATTLSGLTWVNADKAWCAGGNCATSTVKYSFYAARIRHRYAFDSYSLTSMLQRSRTVTWDQMRLKEGSGNKNLCSAHYGYWGYRMAYVSVLDVNGRQIQEKREVWADFPGLSDITDTAMVINGDFGQDGRAKQVPAGSTYAAVGSYAPLTAFNIPEMNRAKDVSRPNMTTDPVFFAMNPRVDDYLSVNAGASPQTTYPLNMASRGLISQSMMLNTTGGCDPVSRPN
jgi:hypothetical protein